MTLYALRRQPTPAFPVKSLIKATVCLASCLNGESMKDQ